MKIYSENRKHLFAIFRQGYHVGNQSGLTVKLAIENYLLSSSYSRNDLIELDVIKNYIAIRAVSGIHYSVQKHMKLNFLDILYRDNELKKFDSMKDKYNVLIQELKQKKVNYADIYNTFILKEVKSYRSRTIPFLNGLKNSFEIKEWLISLKCDILQDENNVDKIIKDSISYGTKPLIY